MKNCKICDRPTFNAFNINFRATPICESCASSITTQQVVYWNQETKSNDPSEEVINIFNLQVENMKALDNYLKYRPNENTKQVAKLRQGISKLQLKLQKLGFVIVVQVQLPSKKTVYDLKMIDPKKKQPKREQSKKEKTEIKAHGNSFAPTPPNMRDNQ